MKKYIIITALLAGNAACAMAPEKNRPITASSRAEGLDVLDHINSNSGIIPGLEDKYSVAYIPVVQVIVNGIPQERDVFECLGTSETAKMDHTKRMALGAAMYWSNHPNVTEVQLVKNGQYRKIIIKKQQSKL